MNTRWNVNPSMIAFVVVIVVQMLGGPGGLRAEDSTESLIQRAKEQKLVEVGSTKDACSRGNGVRFASKNGDVTVAAASSQLVELPAVTRELYWYCGDTRERCANDQPFDWVLCERAGNGAINWRFYKAP